MDYTFNKTLLVILSLSSLLLSSNAVPSTRVIDSISTSVPAAAPKSSFIDFTSTRFPAKAPSSIDIISKSFPAVDASNSRVGNVVTKVDPEILKICNEAGDRKKYCIETLSKLFEGPFDVVKAAEIEVNNTLDIAKTLIDTLSKMPNDTVIRSGVTIVMLHNGTINDTYGALGGCLELYGWTLDYINKTSEFLSKQDFVSAYDFISRSTPYLGTCDDMLADYLAEAPPGTEKPWDVEPLVQSIVICIDILAYIVNNLKI